MEWNQERGFSIPYRIRFSLRGTIPDFGRRIGNWNDNYQSTDLSFRMDDKREKEGVAIVTLFYGNSLHPDDRLFSTLH